jgi:hypothetical protein
MTPSRQSPFDPRRDSRARLTQRAFVRLVDRPVPTACSVLAALPVGAVLVSFADMLRSFAVGAGPLPGNMSFACLYVWSSVISVAALFLHGVPIVALGAWAQRWAPAQGLAIALAAFLGGWWSTTLLEGDGVRALPDFVYVRSGAVVSGATALASVVWLVAMSHKTAGRRVVLALLVAGGWATSLVAWPQYRTFHGALALFNSLLLAWLLRSLFRSWHRTGTLLIGGAAAVAAFATWPGTDFVTRSVLRYTHVPAALATTMPLLSWAMPSTPSVFLNDLATAEEIARWRAMLTPAPPGPRRGDNVLLIVLESTRSETWRDPGVTPRFHEWKRHGLYVPEAISQYPATPLAYGAIFCAQPPSVLVQTGGWARPLLFDSLRADFSRMILTRPDVSWFDTTAITHYFVPPGTPANKHRSVSEALVYLRTEIEAAQGASFFAWAHIYEPHQPWERWESFLPDPTDNPEALYRSEVARVDAALGPFMEWFFSHPASERTLVIVLGDHGEGTGQIMDGKPFFGHHVHVHGVLSRVPAFVAGPGLPQGEESASTQLAQLDIMPTMFDFLGIALPERALAQGTSIYQIRANGAADRELITEAFSIRGNKFFAAVSRARTTDAVRLKEQYASIAAGGQYPPKLALQRGAWKIILDRLMETVALHHVADDPLERRDMCTVQPETCESLRLALTDWRRRQAWIVQHLDRF